MSIEFVTDIFAELVGRPGCNGAHVRRNDINNFNCNPKAGSGPWTRGRHPGQDPWDPTVPVPESRTGTGTRTLIQNLRDSGPSDQGPRDPAVLVPEILDRN